MSRYNNEFVKAPAGLVIDAEKSKEDGRAKYKEDPRYKPSVLPVETLCNPTRRKKRKACSDAGVSVRKYKHIR